MTEKKSICVAKDEGGAQQTKYLLPLFKVTHGAVGETQSRFCDCTIRVEKHRILLNLSGKNKWNSPDLKVGKTGQETLYRSQKRE